MNVSLLPQIQSEPLIGTAVTAATFILLETPHPWIKPALLSDGVPESLRQVVKSQLGPESGVRVHLIANEQTATQQQRRMFVFQQVLPSLRKRGSQRLARRLVHEYEGWVIQVDTPEDMAPALSKFLASSAQANRANYTRMAPEQRHLMICTHATHNECCGVYGYPFYQTTIARIRELGLTQQIHPWEITHIGGHRFAPTLIDWPQGRYYGNLDETSLMLLLQQKGAIAPLLATYRGWSLLPKPLQVLEAELFQQHGWDWLQGRVAGRILNQHEAHKQFRIELWFESAEQQLSRYTAEVCQNVLQTYQLESDVEQDSNRLLHRKTG
ncbi:MAG: sucrase ferredoxin [Cyanobacteria bacterium J06638_28]